MPSLSSRRKEWGQLISQTLDPGTCSLSARNSYLFVALAPSLHLRLCQMSPPVTHPPCLSGWDRLQSQTVRLQNLAALLISCVILSNFCNLSVSSYVEGDNNSPNLIGCLEWRLWSGRSKCSLEISSAHLVCYSSMRFGNMGKVILLGNQHRKICSFSLFHQCVSLRVLGAPAASVLELCS